MKKRTIIALAAIAAVAVAAAAITDVAAAQDRGRGLFARLSQGDAIDGVQPRGKAAYREGPNGPRNLVVTVGRVNLPEGTRLQVNACDGTVGWITLRTGRRGTYTGGRLRLRVRAEDPVPNCDPGDPITVNGSGVSLSGTLGSRR